MTHGLLFLIIDRQMYLGYDSVYVATCGRTSMTRGVQIA